MNDQIPIHLLQRVDMLVASGDFRTRAEVLEAALSLLERECDLAAIREGIADMEAGRCIPLEVVEREMRERHAFLRDTEADDLN
jgi:predicted transcriptional regulator